MFIIMIRNSCGERFLTLNILTRIKAVPKVILYWIWFFNKKYNFCNMWRVCFNCKRIFREKKLVLVYKNCLDQNVFYYNYNFVNIEFWFSATFTRTKFVSHHKSLLNTMICTFFIPSITLNQSFGSVTFKPAKTDVLDRYTEKLGNRT